MKDYEVTYHECYLRTYDVKANSREEAEEIVFNDIMEGKRTAPDECYNSFYITEETGTEENDVRQYEKAAREFVTAIKEIANKETNLENFESYLSNHFVAWMDKFANTPDGIVSELKQFAGMER